MRILQVLPALVSGGVERGAVEMVRAIVGAGGTALVASAGGKMVADVERAGGRHVLVRLATRDPLNILFNARQLSRLIRAEDVGLVHARSRAPAWSARMAARARGAAFVTTYHGVYSENFPGKRQYNAVMASGDRVIAISDFVADLLRTRHQVGEDRLRVIPRGVDPAVFDPGAVPGPRLQRLLAAWRVPDGAPVIVLAGRISAWKGQSVLLHALPLLRTTDAHAVFVGRGRDGAIAGLSAKAVNLGVGDRVRIVGDCDDMPAALLLADAVVHASIKPEAFGRVVIEAQAMGRPVIAADLGGPRETVESGVSGWLTSPGDPRALAGTLDYVLSLPAEARVQLGVQARAAVLARYTVATMQAATLDVYRELLQEPRPQS